MVCGPDLAFVAPKKIRIKRPKTLHHLLPDSGFLIRQVRVTRKTVKAEDEAAVRPALRSSNVPSSHDLTPQTGR